MHVIASMHTPVYLLSTEIVERDPIGSDCELIQLKHFNTHFYINQFVNVLRDQMHNCKCIDQHDPTFCQGLGY
jgi:hypothetical protein